MERDIAIVYYATGGSELTLGRSPFGAISTVYTIVAVEELPYTVAIGTWI